MKKIKLKRHESFSVREGWIEKFLSSETGLHNQIFVKNNGIEILGIGANMVKSLKYWLISANIIDANSSGSLTDFGNLLLNYDRYLESNLSLSLIHYFFSSKRKREWASVDCPIFTVFFNHFKQVLFTKNDLSDYIYNYFSERGIESKKEYIESDVLIMMRTYSDDAYNLNPEDNYLSPLRKLILITKKEKNIYMKTSGGSIVIDPLVVYYALYLAFPTHEFELSDAFSVEDSPTSLFNIDKTSFIHFLNVLKNDGYLTLNKTAGLDMVYLNKKLELSDLYKIRFGE